ncbi:MAG: hypothetical protein J5898_11630 [Lachnospiraceae bacterium]|nr:hypothetical protein [Lachnospiraceae bacterium]
MSKRKIVFLIYTLNLILLLGYSTVAFGQYPLEAVWKNKTSVTVKWKAPMDNDTYIDTLYSISDEMGGDLMLHYVTKDNKYQFYRTERDPSFIPLDGMDPGLRYSTKANSGEIQIKGFFFLPSSDFQIAPLRSLKDENIDLSVQRLWISTDKLDFFSDLAADRGMELSTGHGAAAIDADYSLFYIALGAMGVFLAVSVVFYAVSRSKDMVIKKTFGYTNRDIVVAELRENSRLLLRITGILLLLAFALFAVLFGISPTLLFFKENVLKIILYLSGAVLLMLAFVFHVSIQCDIRSSKGKSFDRQVFSFTLLFKTAILLLLCVSLAELWPSVRTLYTEYQATKNSAEVAEGYAMTVLNAQQENPQFDPERYAPILLSFYRRMHDEHNLVIARFPYRNQYENRDMPYVISARVNDNYLDAFDTIYGTDGKPLHADCLIPGKFNYLIPEGYDPSDYMKKHDYLGYTEDEFHFIPYSVSSSFFTFSNISMGNGFISADAIDAPMMVEVVDPELISQKESVFESVLELTSALTGSGFFTYNIASEQGPYEQVLPIVLETGMDKIFKRAPTLRQEFLAELQFLEQILLTVIVKILFALFSLAIFSVNASELDYKIHSRDLAVKCVNGHSIWDVLLFRVLRKFLIIPIFLLLTDAGLLSAIGCVLIELLIYIPCMKRRYKTNAVTVLKGE